MASVSSDVKISLREEEDLDLKKKERKKKKEETEKKKKEKAEKKKKETIKVAKKRKRDEPIMKTLSAKSGQSMIKPKPAKGRAKLETTEVSKKKCPVRTSTLSPSKKKEIVALQEIKEKRAETELNKISKTLTDAFWTEIMAHCYPKTPLTFEEWPKAYDEDGNRTNEELDVECSNYDAKGLCKLTLCKYSNLFIRFCCYVFKVLFQCT